MIIVIIIIIIVVVVASAVVVIEKNAHDGNDVRIKVWPIRNEKIWKFVLFSFSP